MNRAGAISNVTLGDEIRIDELVAVARYNATVAFNENYKKRVRDSRNLVEQFVKENRRIYGVTTGVGDNVNRVIPESEAMRYQENILLSHCTTVGEPLDIEGVRAIMVAMLANMGSGYSGVRLALLDKIAEMLNKHVTPWAPQHGSVGYLGVEAHIGLVLLGKGRAYYKGELLCGADAMQKAGIETLQLSYKEGLCLISGTTSPTALSALALYDAQNALATADAIASLTLEALCGNMKAFDERIMSVKRQPDQWKSADNLRKLLVDSQLIQEAGGKNLQDALSLRCIPQAHGAARKTLKDARESIENELNSCADNPIIHPSGEAMSACNPDAGFVGIASDTLAIAACYLAKISERRTDRMLNEHLSGLPAFLVASPGENSGYMIVQYASAGLLGEMRVLAHPASIDAVPTCAMQEDYTSMGYNAAHKARKIVAHLEYILGNELLTAVQALALRKNHDLALSKNSDGIIAAVREKVVFMEKDHYIHPEMEWTRELVHSGRVRAISEKHIGEMI